MVQNVSISRDEHTARVYSGVLALYRSVCLTSDTQDDLVCSLHYSTDEISVDNPKKAQMGICSPDNQILKAHRDFLLIHRIKLPQNHKSTSFFFLLYKQIFLLGGHISFVQKRF